MLARLYVEARISDEDLADQVWELWDAGLISDELAAIAWCAIAFEQKHLKFESTGLTSVGCRAF